LKGVAHISFIGGGVIMPSHTPYEREILVQHVEAATKRHGSVRLAVDRQDWTISVSAQHRAVCTRCSRRAGVLTYRFAGTTLCTPCARRTLQ
jgi:hypothetical protein